jgi:two-component system phosphate regulon response regulator OmpR
VSADLLIADDDAALRAALAEYLCAYGLHVRAVADGVALKEALRAAPADLVVLDLNMPGEDGLSLARGLRGGEFGDPAIIMLTGASDVVDRVAGLEVGADDYVAKPCDPRELLARIRAVLRRRNKALAPVAGAALVRMGDKTLDLEGRCLIGPDQERQVLHPREYELLAAFAARPGRVLTRERLLDLAHPHGDEAFDRSIDVRIARIRRKLEADPANPRIIRTVRGAGYVFDPDGKHQA